MRAHDVQAGPPRKDVSNPEDNVPSGKEEQSNVPSTTPVTGKTRSTRSGTATTLPESKGKIPETVPDSTYGIDDEELIDYNDLVSDGEETVLDGTTSSAKQIAAKAEAVVKVAMLAQGIPADTITDTSMTLSVEGLTPLPVEENKTATGETSAAEQQPATGENTAVQQQTATGVTVTALEQTATGETAKAEQTPADGDKSDDSYSERSSSSSGYRESNRRRLLRSLYQPDKNPHSCE